jgi:Xaa-Pro dipeptidase
MTKGVGGSDAAVELAALSPWPNPAGAITPAERRARLEMAHRLMAEQGVDALLIGAGPSLNYFSGIPWGASERLVALIIFRGGDLALIAPMFELGSLQADLALEARVLTWEEDEEPFALVAAALREGQAGRLAIDPAMSFHFVCRLKAVSPMLEVSDATPIIDACRRIKSPAELAIMSQAKAMTLEVHRRAARMLKPGISATAVRRFIEAAHRALGAEGSSFCIVLFGAATAFPHGLPGDQILEAGDVVLIDTGCWVKGYSSDITRTYVFGEPRPDQRRIWEIEREAQIAAFNAVRPGVACEAVDFAARKVLEGAGLGPDYRLPGLPHRTGHGIGMAIHEAPYLVRGDKTPLMPGMCFSNEPMIVVPGEFGVRLEDHFHVTETGAAWFTQPSPSVDAPFG